MRGGAGWGEQTPPQQRWIGGNHDALLTEFAFDGFKFTPANPSRTTEDVPRIQPAHRVGDDASLRDATCARSRIENTISRGPLRPARSPEEDNDVQYFHRQPSARRAQISAERGVFRECHRE